MVVIYRYIGSVDINTESRWNGTQLLWQLSYRLPSTMSFLWLTGLLHLSSLEVPWDNQWGERDRDSMKHMNLLHTVCVNLTILDLCLDNIITVQEHDNIVTLCYPLTHPWPLDLLTFWVYTDMWTAFGTLYILVYMVRVVYIKLA